MRGYEVLNCLELIEKYLLARKHEVNQENIKEIRNLLSRTYGFTLNVEIIKYLNEHFNLIVVLSSHKINMNYLNEFLETVQEMKKKYKAIIEKLEK